MTGAFSDGLSQPDGASAFTPDESGSDVTLLDDGTDPQGPSCGPAFAGLIPTNFSAGTGSPAPSVDSEPGSSSSAPGMVAHPQVDAPRSPGSSSLNRRSETRRHSSHASSDRLATPRNDLTF